MAVKFETVVDLFEQEDWASCASHAAKALAEGEWTKDKKAFLNLMRSTSLRRYDQNTEALEPGRLALYLAEDVGDFDLLGRALANLAWIQHKIIGMESAAVDTQQRFLALFSNYKTPAVKAQYITAMRNLGVYLRAAGMYDLALRQFKETYRIAKQRDDLKSAQLSRTAAVWEALRLEYITEAEELIREGEEPTKADSRLRAAHLLDKAQLSLLKMDAESAIGYVFTAAPLILEVQESKSDPDPHLLPQALEILERAAERVKEPRVALILGVEAKLTAELDDRHDIVAEVKEAIRVLAFQQPEVVAQVMDTLDGRK